MTLTRLVKVLAYAAAAGLAICWALWTVGPLYGAEEPVAAYLRSDLLLFIAACTLTGIGVYTWLAYTRRHREHLADSRFFLIFGAAVLLFTVGIVLRFGGLTQENFDPAKAAMINLNLMAAGALPIPLLVRTWILVPGCEKGGKQVMGAAAALVPTAVYAVLIMAGRLLHTASYAG